MAKKPRKPRRSFDERIGRAKKKKGMSDAYYEAGILFRIKSHEGGIWIARRKESFSCDDIQAWMQENHPNVTPLHPNAWGGVMRALAVDGVCTKLQETVNTHRPSGHWREIGVWWSLIYEGAVRVKKPRRRTKLDPNQLDIFDLPGDDSEPA